MVAKKKIAKKKLPSLHFVLEGKVLVEERDGDKVVSCSELSGDTVLKILIMAFEQGVGAMIKKHKLCGQNKVT